MSNDKLEEWCYRFNFALMAMMFYELRRFKVYVSIDESKCGFGFCVWFKGGNPNPDFDRISILVSPLISGNRGCKKPNIIEIMLLKKKCRQERVYRFCLSVWLRKSNFIQYQ
jgi:hypothetical protein